MTTEGPEANQVVQRPMPRDRKPLDSRWTLLRDEIKRLPVATHEDTDNCLMTNYTARQVYAAMRGVDNVRIVIRTLPDGRVLVWRRS